jgi:DNA-binding response OmpR family regulator
MKILLVDDDKAVLRVLAEMLSTHSHDVHSAESAEEAYNKIKNDTYDFMLLDYKMPDQNGDWLLEKAKVPRHTKILMMTAFIDRAVINRMFDLGISGYLIKPFEEADLLRNINFFASKSA